VRLPAAELEVEIVLVIRGAQTHHRQQEQPFHARMVAPVPPGSNLHFVR
jgi:hypothetical protein